MIPTHKLTISVKYKSSHHTKTYLFNKKPNKIEKEAALKSFNNEFKRYNEDILEMELKKLNLKLIQK